MLVTKERSLSLLNLINFFKKCKVKMYLVDNVKDLIVGNSLENNWNADKKLRGSK